MTHTVLLALGFGLALIAGASGAVAVRLIPPEAGRTPALAALGLPLFILGLTSVHLVPAIWAECTPPAGPDLAVAAGWFLLVGWSAAASAVSGLRRMLLAERLLAAIPAEEGHPLTGKVRVLADRLGIRTPSVRVLEVDRPLAVSGGLRRPAIIVSRWLLENLNESELEAVVAHELGHLARSSQPVLWLGRLLRDAAWYVPSGRYAFRALVRAEELAADDLAVGLTCRPLALAGALGRVWLGGPGPVAGGLAGLIGDEVDAGRLLEVRLSRLLAGAANRDRWPAAPILAGAVVGLLAVGTWQLLGLAAEALPLVCRFGLRV